MKQILREFVTKRASGELYIVSGTTYIKV